jgi:transcriptional regulator with XRE-family HTH domain
LITGPQIRAARGFLAWDRRDLAKKAVVTIYTVERIETSAEISGTAMVKGLAAIKGALEAEGIEFIDDADAPGVRIHLKKKQSAGQEQMKLLFRFGGGALVGEGRVFLPLARSTGLTGNAGSHGG